MAEHDEWPLHDAQPGETIGDAIIRLRREQFGPFRLRHNDVVWPVSTSADVDDVRSAMMRERHRLAEEKDRETLALMGGRYNMVRVGASVPDVILVGPSRVRYVAVRDPVSDERIGFVHLPEDDNHGG